MKYLLEYLQYFTKYTYSFLNISLFCINFWWITKNFLKCTYSTKFYILFWKLILISNLYENMLTILCFIFLYHKLQLCLKSHVHYTPLTCGKGLLKFEIFVQ
jgi:hypothetical protein